MSIDSVMPSNHLTLCCPLLLLPSIFPSIRVFSNESVLHIRWPKGVQNSPKPMAVNSGTRKTASAKKSVQSLLIFLKAGDELRQERRSPTPGGGEHSSHRSPGGGGCFEPKKNQKVLHMFVCLFVCHKACRLLVPQPGIEPGPWQQKHRVLTPGPPGNSQDCTNFAEKLSPACSVPIEFTFP